MTNYQWQPGNGTNYDIKVVQHEGKTLLCWMRGGGSGGVCMQFHTGGFLDWSYMSEKMAIRNRADLAGILAFVHEMKLAEAGMPEGYGLDGLDDAHRRAKDAYRDRFGHTGLEPQLKKEEGDDAWAKHASDAADSFLESLKKGES